MANTNLWNLVSELKTPAYKFVELSHVLSPETPHWYGFNPLQCDVLFDYVEGTPDDKMAPMRCYQISVASQYGTHVDAPLHFHGNGRAVGDIPASELVMPLVVIDKSAACAANAEFTRSVQDILDKMGD